MAALSEMCVVEILDFALAEMSVITLVTASVVIVYEMPDKKKLDCLQVKTSIALGSFISPGKSTDTWLEDASTVAITRGYNDMIAVELGDRRLVYIISTFPCYLLFYEFSIRMSAYELTRRMQIGMESMLRTWGVLLPYCTLNLTFFNLISMSISDMAAV